MRIQHLVILLIVLILGTGCGFLIENSLIIEPVDSARLGIQDFVAVLIEKEEDFFDKYSFLGTGSEGDPYIIEGHYGQALLNTPVIEIRDIDAYIEIKNNQIWFGSIGIKLTRVSHCKIDNNNIYDSSGRGIYIDQDCTDINITRNKIFNHPNYGIEAYNNNNNTIINGNTIFNTSYGIRFVDGYFNNISDNTLTHCKTTGIYAADLHFSNVSRNTITDVYEYTGTPGYGDGIYLQYSRNNTISYNTISQIAGYGVEFESSSRFNNLDHNNISYTQEEAIFFNYLLATNNTVSNNIIQHIEDYAIYESGKWNHYYDNVIYNTSFTAVLLDSYCTFSGNKISHSNNNGIGINGPGNTVTHNTVMNCSGVGIYIEDSSENGTFKSNYIANNSNFGLYMDRSPNNTLEDNVIENNGGDFYLDGFLKEDFIHEMSNNTLDGKELGYFKNLDGSIPFGSFDRLIIANCSNFDVVGRTFEEGSYGITIAYSSNFSVSNNVFRDLDYGLELVGAKNGLILGNDVYDCTGVGFYITYSENLVFEGNEFHSNSFQHPGIPSSIYMYQCLIATIHNNNIHDNQGLNIYLYHTSYIDITANTLVNCDNTNIYSYLSLNTTISNNYIYGNLGYGVQLRDSINCSIFANNITNSGSYGVYLRNSNNNEVFLNEFHNNTVVGLQASDNGVDNSFEMNYWDDHDLTDSGGDGYADSPYIFTTNQDSLPLAAPYHISAPTVIFPNGGTTLNDILTIDWSPSTDSLGLSLTYSVFYSSDAGITWNVLASGLDVASYEWNTKGFLNSTEYLVKIVAINTYGVSSEDTSDSIFTISNVAHVVSTPEIIYPTGGGTVSGFINIQWTPSVDTWNSSVQITYAVYYSPNAGTSWVELVGSIESTSLIWNSETVDDGFNYLIKVLATSEHGLVREATTSLFTVDNTPQITTEPTTDFTTTLSTEVPTEASSSESSTIEEFTSTTPSTSTPGWTITPILILAIYILYQRKRKRNKGI